MRPQPFFLIWNPSRGAPTVKQATYPIAEAEAKRLARQAPGEEFFILAAVARVEKIDVGVTRFEIDPDMHDDEIPF